MRYKVARTISRRMAAAALAVAFCVVGVGVGAEWALIESSAPTPHGAHALAVGPYSDFADIAEHPHAAKGTTPLAPETVAHAVLPRATTVLATLGLVAAVAILATLWRHTASTGVRGPPRPIAYVLLGRHVLTQLCIARR